MTTNMKMKMLSLLLCFLLLLGMLPTTALAADEIKQVELTLDVPTIGNTLDFEPTTEAENYEITSVRWLKDWGEHGNMLCDVYHTVEPGEPYKVRIWISPKEGYSFADLDDVTVTVNGSTDGVTFTYDDLYTGIVCSVAFDELGYNVSFDANGGTGTMEKVTEVYPDYSLPACGFTAPAGKVFNGWTVNSPSGAWYAVGSTMDINANVKLYAKWADPAGSHKITFVNRTTDPYTTVEMIVSEGMYTLPGIEGIFQNPDGHTFDEWEISVDGMWQYFAPGKQISVTEDLEINATWKPIVIDYERITKAELEVTLAPGVEYKHGMPAGALSVSLGEVNGTYDDPLPVSLVSGGYGHGYWISFGDMLPGTDTLSTRESYRLHVRIDIPEDRDVFIDPDGVKLIGPFGEIDVWQTEIVEGDYTFCFNLPTVSGTPLSADAVTFTFDGYAIDQTIPAVTVASSTAHVSLRGSGYGIDNPYMIYEDYVDFDTKVTDPRAKFEKHQDYCLMIDYALDEGYTFPESFWDGSNLKKDKFKLAGFEDAVVTDVTETHVIFRLPQLGTTAVEALEITLNGYEAGKIAGDVSLTAPECMNLPFLDDPMYPPYGRLYCYYDPSYGFGDSADGDCNPISYGTALNVGDQYPFTIKFYPVDGYDYSDLKKEDITLVTPYGNCTATRFRPGFSENSYWLTFDLPAIGAVAATPITSVTISDLEKPVVDEMPNNNVTVSGTGVTVDDEGSYWGRFDPPRFSPVYDDDTAVDSVPFRDGETYMFQIYLNAADGYEFTADSKFYFEGKELSALDMSDLSKTGVMVNPEDSTQAIVYINMNDIAHVHIPGDWAFNETHHWHKCTDSGCDAGTDVSSLPDYAEHSFVNGLCACGAHQHNWSAEWSVDETHHWHECAADGCTAADNSGKNGYAAHDFTVGACVCGVENMLGFIEISGITAPVVGEMPINSASVDQIGAETDEENTFWVRYDTSTGRIRDTYTDGTSVHNTPFRDGEIYLLQITIKLKTGYRFTPDAKLLYESEELLAPDATNPTASCGAIAPDHSMAMALINPNGASVPLTYTVSFDANGGTGTMTEVTGISGEYTLPENGFTAPNGKQFKAWCVDGTEKAVGDKITVIADTTVSAVWADIPAPTEYDITVTGGTASANKAVAGTEITLTVDESAIPAGKVFDKWEVVSGGVTVADGKFTMPESAVEIKATYKDALVVTETPVISYEVTDNAVIITATGKGEVKLYADDDEPVNNPYIIPRGETEITVTFTATAKEEGKEISETVTKSVTAPAVQPTEYDITVTGGTASANKAVAGTVITLTVDESAVPAGKVFDKWEVVGGGVTVTDGKFTMPANAVEVKATYKDAPASHTCDIKPVAKNEPSCTEGGKEAYYKCEGCGKFFEDALGATEITDLAAWGNINKNDHTASDWKSDRNNHWKECTVAACGAIINGSKAAHTDANNDGKCDACEYNVDTTPDDTNKPENPTNPEDTNKPSDDIQSPQTGGNSTMWLWVALLFVGGFGIAAITVIDKKRSVR